MKTEKKEKHRSTLKQVNKKHNKLGHKSKGQVADIIKGRAEKISSLFSKPRRELNRLERKNKLSQVRTYKKEKNLLKKQSLGTDSQPPFLISVIILSPDINPRQVLSSITKADAGATVVTSKQGNTHLSSAMFKQRFTFVVPPVDDMYAILDSVKVSTTVLIVWPCCERGEEVIGAKEEKLLSTIKAQGLPTPVHAVLGFQDMSQKKKGPGYQNLMTEVNHYFPGHDKAKIYQLDKPGEPLLCLRQLGSQKQRSLFFRDHRPHLIAEKVEFVDEVNSSTSGTLAISGYIRGVPLAASALVHIPGWNDYQMTKITVHGADPHPLTLPNKKRMILKEDVTLYPDSDAQHSLSSTRDEDSSDDESVDSGSVDMDESVESMGDESDGDSDESAAESLGDRKPTEVPTVTSKVPKGVHDEFTASWLVEGVKYGYSDEDDDAEEDEFVAPPPMDDASSTVPDDEDDRMSTVSSAMSVKDDNYDDDKDYTKEMEEYDRLQECKDDLEFPDEVDTPREIPARERFCKYRGLESFKSSPWDLDENLPDEYKMIYNIPYFNRFRKKILKMSAEMEGAEPGSYVTIHISNVEKHLYIDHMQSGSPLVLFGMMPYENKTSLANYVITSHPSGHTSEIKSKERLIFHVGFRRFVNQPIFSEHTNGEKQKFCKFFRPRMCVVASMYAPITYPPACVLVFKESSGGRQDLVATGSVYNYDVDRCVLKRIVLSGHPFKINKRLVTVRYMFFDRDDINWYKTFDLSTKYGKRGKIKEPLGTHGHMKCQFSGILKSQDTVLLTLYKRVFPKMCYDAFVPRPSKRSPIAELEEVKEQKMEEKTAMLPPAVPASKRVRFQ